MTSKLSFESYTVDEDIAVIKLNGQLDVSSSEAFEQEIAPYVDAGTTKIIIDCARLGYISSFGIGILVSLLARLRKRGGDVKLSAIQGTVADVIKVVGLAKLLGIYGDIEFARESFYDN